MDVDHRSFENIRSQSRMNPMWSLIKYCFRYWHWLIGGGTSAIVTRLARLAPPIIVATAIDRVIGASGDPGILALFGLMPEVTVPETAVQARYDLLFHLVLIAVLAYLVRAITRFLSRYLLQSTAQKVQRDLRNETYRHMQSLSMSFYDQHETGGMMSILNNDINRLEEFLNTELTQIIRVTTIVTGIGAVMLYVQPMLALIALIPVPFIGFASGSFLVWIDKKYRAIREIVSRINSRLANNLGGMKVIKSFTREEHEADQVSRQSERYHDRQVGALKIRRAYFSCLRLTTGVAFVAILYFGGHRVIEGDMSVGSFTLFFLLLRRLYGPMRRIGRTANKYQLANSSAERVFGILGLQPEMEEPDDPYDPDRIEGEVAFRKVWFSYPETQPVLRNITLDIEPGETVGFVGRTGAGKSTLLKLIPRFYDVNRGSVLVDGVDVRDYRLVTLRESVSIVDQDPYLFSGTVLENIAYGNGNMLRDVRRDQVDDKLMDCVRETARHAEADRFIEDLPEGYHTQIGERGVKLSGGQRQRLSIARAILNDPSIIIFDEATSDVDTETETFIQKSLERICENRTALLIAHRLSTLREADRIVVLEAGEIHAIGNHDKLLANDDLYAELWRGQSDRGVENRELSHSP
ncbi:MAG: ABC transporter ATP-binding protein [bacterium]